MNWKNLFNILFYLLIYGLPLHSADDTQTLMNWKQGIEALSRKNLASAQHYFESLPDKGYGPWRMLGLIAEQKKEYPLALIAYTHAQKEVTPLFIHDAVTNIVRTQELLQQDSNRLFEYFKTLLYAIPPLIIQLLFLFFWLVAMYFFSLKKKNTKAIYFFYVSLVLLALYVVQVILFNPMFVYVRESTPLYIGPSTDFQQRKTIKAGDKVIVEKMKNNWLKVVHENEKGWIMADIIEKI